MASLLYVRVCAFSMQETIRMFSGIDRIELVVLPCVHVRESVAADSYRILWGNIYTASFAC